MYKTVLFDLDGTLLNTIDDLADSANRVCAAHGWPQYETAQYRYFVGNGIPKLVERFSPANCRSPEQRQDRGVPRYAGAAGPAKGRRGADGGVLQQGGRVCPRRGCAVL